MKSRTLLLSTALAVLAAVFMVGSPTATPAAAPSELALRTVTGKLDELEQMVKYQWWGRAKKNCELVESLVKTNAVSNPIILDRVSAARKSIDAQAASQSADPESRRLADLIQRVRAVDNSFPEKPQTIRVKPGDGGDVHTVAEALARGDDRQIIELYTGTYLVNLAELGGKGKDGRGRPHVFFAARGEWPRLVPTTSADFTLDHRQWLDGVEIVPGISAIAKDWADLHNGYVRAAEPPRSATTGPSGLINADPAAVDCVFQNFITALAPGKNAAVSRNLFVACMTAIRRDGADTTLDRCAFYRCRTVVANAPGESFKGSHCVFSRVKNFATDKTAIGQHDCQDCLSSDDPFRDPFRGDFRLRADLNLPGELASKSPPGPNWSDERWEMFVANFDRPLEQAPISLAEVRDPEAVKALADLRKTYERKDYPAAATALAPVLERYAGCPSVRAVGPEVDRIAADVLAELVRQGSTGDKNRQLAAEQLRQATTLRDDGKKDEALATAHKAAESDPQSIDAQQMIAELLLDTGRPAQADPFIKRAAELIEAEADSTPAAVKLRQGQIRGRVDKLANISDEWQRLIKAQAKKYFDVAVTADKRSPSYSLGLRRALLLSPGNKDYESKLAEGESMLKKLLIDVSDKPDAEKAARDRAEANDKFQAKKFDEAAVKARNAYYLDPTIDDLLFIARCYRTRQQTATEAAVIAYQARQQATATSMPDQAKRDRIIAGATEILLTVDKPMGILERLDGEFVKTLKVRHDAAEAAGNKDSAEQMADVLAKLQKIDSAELKASPKKKGE